MDHSTRRAAGLELVRARRPRAGVRAIRTRAGIRATRTRAGVRATARELEVALSLGLDGRGWTVSVGSPCFGGAALSISGVDDAPYPQTAVRPFLDETSAYLFLTNEDSDSGVTSGRYVSNPSGSSTVEYGPREVDGEKVVKPHRGPRRPSSPTRADARATCGSTSPSDVPLRRPAAPAHARRSRRC